MFHICPEQFCHHSTIMINGTIGHLVTAECNLENIFSIEILSISPKHSALATERVVLY